MQCLTIFVEILSTIVCYLKELKVLARTSTPSTFGRIFKWSKIYQTSPTTISRHSTHFIPNNRTNTSGCYLTILHFKNRQKVYFQHNFIFLPIQRKGLILISNLIFELPRTLINNLYFPNINVAFPSTKLVLQFLFKY